VIYDKIYHQRDAFAPQTVDVLASELEARGLRYRIFRYGSYIHHEYIAALRATRSLAFFAHSETQGHAYQEAMAMNIPIFAWDEGVWLDPLARDVSDKPIPASSVPHFDARCGMRFKAAHMLATFGAFWEALDTFQPRAFVAETLSLKGSAELYASALRDAAQTGASRVAPATSREPSPSSHRAARAAT
jgi:hypothetical protein